MTIQVDDFDVNDIIIRMKPNFTDSRWNEIGRASCRERV